MKAELNSHNRIKSRENGDLIFAIEKRISEEIRARSASETSALREESKLLYDKQKLFHDELDLLLQSVTTKSILRVATQTGAECKRIETYIGSLDKNYNRGQGYFNFISKDRDNSMQPFTIGFSCTQLIEVISL